VVKVLKKVQVKTHCNHCDNEFEKVWICKMESIIGTRYALLCSGCQKLIGIYSSTDFNDPVRISNSIFDELQNSLI
jgi:hypothetical protein